VALPTKQPVTRYLEWTGNTAAVNSVDLVARVQGFLQEINYQDGAKVKRGTVLFIIEPESYKVKLAQAQAAEVGAQATLTQAEAEYKRQADLSAKEFASKSAFDQALATRDGAKANLDQAKANSRLAAINNGYTNVVAPFDGIVSAHQVSVGELVGGGSAPTVLATIVQFDPIYVTFNVSERDVLQLQAEARRRHVTREDLKAVPIEVGLQTEEGYPHKGTLDYVAPSVNQSTGTLPVRGILNNSDGALLPGYFVRIRIPIDTQADALLIPETALGTDQGGLYVLVVRADDTVEQRKVDAGPRVGELRVIEKGLKADDRVVGSGLARVVPGQKIDPQLKIADAPQAN
jgi:RND family efflux transporter MFP subunit